MKIEISRIPATTAGTEDFFIGYLQILKYLKKGKLIKRIVIDKNSITKNYFKKGKMYGADSLKQLKLMYKKE